MTCVACEACVCDMMHVWYSVCVWYVCGVAFVWCVCVCVVVWGVCDVTCVWCGMCADLNGEWESRRNLGALKLSCSASSELPRCLFI